MISQLKDSLIPNIKRERFKVNWLYKININLYEIIKGQYFTDLILWRFEDEKQYLHMELSESTDIDDSEYWNIKTQERIAKRDEYYKNNPSFLPPSRYIDFKRNEQIE